MASPLEPLRQRAEFLRVTNDGKKLKGRRGMVFAAPGRGQGTRLGLVVSRRVGNAVRRNRVRRRVREIVRGAHALLPRGWDLVFIAFPEAAEASFVELSQELTWLLTRARDWASAKHS